MAAAVTDSYATPSEYRDAVGKGDTSDDQTVAADLRAISRYLDRKLMRYFTRDAADVARVFYPRNSPGAVVRPLNWADSENPWVYAGASRWLFIDDLSATPTSIILDSDSSGTFTDTALAANDYELWPQNADKGPEPRPYTAILIPSWSTRLGGFVPGQRIQITGRWGWLAVPAAIQRATIELTAIKRLESPRATSRVTDMDQVVSTSRVGQEIVSDLIREYARKESLV